MAEGSQGKTIQFRKDINGLRTYAVLAVLLYHYGIYGFTGGFIGVDVFFVISGFLMTAIILPRVEAGTFSLTDFYLSRGRRILPALAFLCIAILVFGWFWLAPHHYRLIGKNVGASLLFFSNLIYNRAGGYFASPAEENWLLHTWSLSVEWQFYLIYPLLLMTVARQSSHMLRNITATLVSFLIASLIYSVYKTEADPVSAFFILPARFWELVAGGLVYLYSGKFTLSRKYEYTGLLLIILSALIFNDDTRWPGYFALAPVIGTCLVILAAKNDSIWTCNRFAQAIGRWSYSIYLWHWPVLVGLRYFDAANDMRWTLLAIIASILLGALSYVFIEQTSSRAMRRERGRLAWIQLGFGTAIPFLAASVVYFGGGIQQTFRLPQAALTAAYEKTNMSELTKCNTETSRCVIGQGEVLAVVWGDSHAISTVSAVADAAAKAGGSILFFGQQACPVIFNAVSANRHDKYYCKNFNDMVFSEIQKLDKHVPVIIINHARAYIEPGEIQMYFEDSGVLTAAESKAIYLHNMSTSLCRIAGIHSTYVALPIPTMPEDVPESMSRNIIIRGESPTISTPASTYLDNNAELIQAIIDTRKNCNIHLLDPFPYLCEKGYCRGDVNGRPIYSDTNHLSEFGNRLLVPMFDSIFQHP
jgi:peptidoglycan/LPS O-acetylase OafA/YrhL